MPAPAPAVRTPVIRTLGGRPRAANRRDVSDDGPASDDRPESKSNRQPRPRLARGTGENADAPPSASPELHDDPWEAIAVAAVRTLLRTVRAADEEWATKLRRAADDPAVRSALTDLADAARRFTGSGPESGGSESGEEQEDATPTVPAEPGRTADAETAKPEPRPATPPATKPPAVASPPGGPPASLGEIRERLTFGAGSAGGSAGGAAPAEGGGTATAAPGGASGDGPPGEGSTLRSDDVRDLPRAPDRCRAKAEALRWAADRLAAGAETGPLRARREALETAAEAGETLWPLTEPAPPGAAPADYLRAAAVFEVLAEAALLLDAALDRFLPAGESDPAAGRAAESDRLKSALDLTAEAQSMALIAVRALRERPDRDQVAIYKTIRDVSDARTGIAYFIRNYLREGSHADPAGHADLSSRIAAAAAARGRGKAEREAFKKFAHAAGKVAGHAADESPERFEYHAARLGKFAARLLDAGVPPSDRRFRESAPDDLAPLRRGRDLLAERAAPEPDADDPPPDSVARKQADALRRVLEYLPDPAGEEEEEEDAPVEPRYADSVDAAFARAADEFPEALGFALNSKSVREGYPYARPDRVYLGLKFLATTLRDALAGRVPRSDLAEECVRQCELHYSPNQSASTMGQFPEDYRTVWNGEEVPLTRHLRRGNNKDPRLSVRIAFHYDKAADRVVIGYLGQHQRTRAT